MSPEHDPNVPTSAVDSIHTDPPEESSPAISEPYSGSVMAASASAASGSGGTATAVARAQEPVTLEPPSAEESARPAEMNSAASAETAEIPAVAASPEIAHDAEITAAIRTGEPTESSEAAETAETTETMDQLMDQFAVPEPVAAEGEIFDGRVLAVTDAGVIVDVGGKFEGLVPAQEFVDSGSPIEFGPGQTIEVERLHSRKRRLRSALPRARASPPRLGTHRKILS